MNIKKGDEIMLDTLMYNCGYHQVFDDCNCNNGFICLHPENSEGDNYDCENGCKGCFAFACPLAYQKDPEKDEKECNWGDDTIMIMERDIIKTKEKD